MADKSMSVKATGLKELRAALKAAEDRTPRELTEAHKRIATTAAEKARGIAAGSYISGRAAATIRASGTQSSGRIMLGSDAVPWALGNEFGSAVHRQFKAWLGSGEGAGYALYPALREMGPDIEDMYWDELHALTALGFS